jgi:hypothetical protein
VAEAVLAMAVHPRREMWLTERVVLTLASNAVVPGLLDRYLGRYGVAAQQTGSPADASRATNLWDPVPGDHGVHGAFDTRARRRSPAVWASIHRRRLTGGLAAAALALGVARRGR